MKARIIIPERMSVYVHAVSGYQPERREERAKKLEEVGFVRIVSADGKWEVFYLPYAAAGRG